MSEYTPTTGDIPHEAMEGWRASGTPAKFAVWLAAHDAEVRAGVVVEEPEGPTSMKPFHREYPGLPGLFHTYCSEHPDFGTCEEEVQAHRDIADHLASEHYEVKQEEAEDA
ncbi:hypothetical protein J2D78_01530 [Microbacterium maritypicum]|uniref:hypothetical protein n=1 Tax=Microbacterium maritypicum TaxID=33918 RepID=UPI001B31CB0E|nr:hypothetical protein [Microbacterium liquefaciens]MBP5800755.1 hypothetical protein [Microbacterium liquefaciens]